jgi:hypothetical protein
MWQAPRKFRGTSSGGANLHGNGVQPIRVLSQRTISMRRLRSPQSQPAVKRSVPDRAGTTSLESMASQRDPISSNDWLVRPEAHSTPRAKLWQ